jgi:hypothetical protein
MYLPAVLLLGAGRWWGTSRNDRLPGARTRRLALLLVGFVSPLAAWCLVIVLHSGWERLWTWSREFAWFFHHRGSGVDSGSMSVLQRLRTYEWRTYSPAVKVVVLSSTLGSSLAGCLCLAFRRKLDCSITRSVNVAAVVGTILLFSTWWIAASPLMLIRYLQPAMLLGLCLLGSLAFHVTRRLPDRRHRKVHVIAVALLLLAVGFTTAALRRGPALLAAPSYARGCMDIFGTDCSKEPPRHLPPSR